MTPDEIFEQVVKILTPYVKNQEALDGVSMSTHILDELKVNSARLVDVVLESTPVNSFDQVLGRASATGVKVAAVIEDQTAPRRRYEPSHPDADKEGFVSLPNVDPAEEMVDMLSAARAYQANLTAIGLIRDMVSRALELGK